MFILIVCVLVYDVLNFEIYLSYLSYLSYLMFLFNFLILAFYLIFIFLHNQKSQEKNVSILRTKRAFRMK